VMVLSTLLAVGILITGVDPVIVTEASVAFSAVALPLAYFPILVVANDPDYMGEHTNGRLANGLGTFFLVVIMVAAVAAIPLMVLTRLGS
jgi:Mn2+/Fe2+ NRAMP family transporter